MYNILTGDGFSKALMGDWSMALLGLGIEFFLIAFANKLCEEFDIPWNKMFAWIGGFVGYLLAISITGQARWGLVFGIAGITLGYFSSFFYNEG